MKDTTIETLLKKHEEGSLTDEERDLLETATGKATVMSQACQRATMLRRRRVGMAAGLCSLLLVAGAIVLWQPKAEEMPKMATLSQPQTVREPLPQAETEAAQELPLQEAHSGLEKVQAAVTLPVAKYPRTQRTVVPQQAKETTVALQVVEAPQVSCNLQCDADSVISDVWKFLKA